MSGDSLLETIDFEGEAGFVILVLCLIEGPIEEVSLVKGAGFWFDEAEVGGAFGFEDEHAFILINDGGFDFDFRAAGAV